MLQAAAIPHGRRFHEVYIPIQRAMHGSQTSGKNTLACSDAAHQCSTQKAGLETAKRAGLSTWAELAGGVCTVVPLSMQRTLRPPALSFLLANKGTPTAIKLRNYFHEGFLFSHTQSLLRLAVPPMHPTAGTCVWKTKQKLFCGFTLWKSKWQNAFSHFLGWNIPSLLALPHPRAMALRAQLGRGAERDSITRMEQRGQELLSLPTALTMLLHSQEQLQLQHGDPIPPHWAAEWETHTDGPQHAQQ